MSYTRPLECCPCLSFQCACSVLHWIHWLPRIMGYSSTNTGLYNEALQLLARPSHWLQHCGQHSTGTVMPFKTVQTNHVDFSPWTLASSSRRDQATLSISCEQRFLKPPRKELLTDFTKQLSQGVLWASCSVTPCCILLNRVWSWRRTGGQQVPGVFLSLP